MDCSLIRTELAPYYLGVIDDEARERVEAHLVDCAACVRAYITLKRHAESGAARPSGAARMKLRAAVAAEFETSARARVRRWLRRPIPLYQGLAAASLVAFVAVAAPRVTRAIRTPPAPVTAGERVDTARPSPVSLSFY